MTTPLQLKQQLALAAAETARRRRLKPSWQLYLEWGESRRADFEVFMSQLVLDEEAAGDPAAARERLAASKDLPQLDITDDVAALAGALVASLASAVGSSRHHRGTASLKCPCTTPSHSSGSPFHLRRRGLR